MRGQSLVPIGEASRHPNLDNIRVAGRWLAVLDWLKISGYFL